MKLYTTNEEQDALNSVLIYIFESEMDDFAENPSRSHVYYSAVLLESGVDEAETVLREAKENLKRGDS